MKDVCKNYGDANTGYCALAKSIFPDFSESFFVNKGLQIIFETNKNSLFNFVNK